MAAGGRLDRVSLTTGALLLVVDVPGAAYASVGAPADASVLVDGESTEAGVSRVQRRNPRTGALDAQTPAPIGVSAPGIDGGIWIGESSGIAGNDAIGGGYEYWYAQAEPRVTLYRAPVPAACRTGRARP